MYMYVYQHNYTYICMYVCIFYSIVCTSIHISRYYCCCYFDNTTIQRPKKIHTYIQMCCLCVRLPTTKTSCCAIMLLRSLLNITIKSKWPLKLCMVIFDFVFSIFSTFRLLQYKNNNLVLVCLLAWLLYYRSLEFVIQRSPKALKCFYFLVFVHSFIYRQTDRRTDWQLDGRTGGRTDTIFSLTDTTVGRDGHKQIKQQQMSTENSNKYKKTSLPFTTKCTPSKKPTNTTIKLQLIKTKQANPYTFFVDITATILTYT